jgi:hypothetical protein
MYQNEIHLKAFSVDYHTNLIEIFHLVLEIKHKVKHITYA